MGDGAAHQELLADAVRLMADAAPVLIWVADPAGDRISFSRGWSRFTGRPPELERGGGWMAGVHPDDVTTCSGAIGAAVDQRRAFETTYRLRRHDGADRWVLDRATPLLDEDGGFSGFVGACVDVDDLVAAGSSRDELLEGERRARADLEAAAHLLGRLQRITAAFAAALTPDGVYELVTAEAVVAADAVAGSICLVDDDQHTLRLVRSIGYPGDVLSRFSSFDIDADLPIAEAVRDSRPVFISSLDLRTDVVTVVGERRAAAALPLVIGGDPVGALGLSFTDEQPFDELQRSFLEAVAYQCAAALERTRLYEAEQAGRRAAEAAQHRLGFLSEATRALASSLDRQEILERLTRLSVPRLADSATVWLPVGDRHLQRVTLAYDRGGIDPDFARGVRRPQVPLDVDNPLARCFTTGVEQLVEVDEALLSGAGVPRDLVSRFPELRVHTSLLVPITSRGAVLGVMLFNLVDRVRSFTDADVAVALELGARAGTAMDNAASYEREHSIAATLQLAILPAALPEPPDFELAARYLPATSGLRVGGDWYDAFHLRDGRVGLAVGDVAGHGLRAAAIMGQLRNGLRAYAIDGDPPATVLERLNRLLLDTEHDTLATAFYGILDPATGRLTWCSAGHPVPVVGGERTMALPATTSLVLGVDGDATFTEDEASIAPGDVVLFYTDGLVERRGEHLDEGLRRLLDLLLTIRDVSVRRTCDAVVAGMLDEVDRPDDVCVLGLRRHGP